MATSVEFPYPIYVGLNGEPLDEGTLFVGEANKNAITDPVNVYTDSSLTALINQPLQINDGYVIYNASPQNIFISQSDYSLVVRDKQGQTVITIPSAAALSTDIGDRWWVNVLDFGAVGDGITDNSVAVQQAVDFAIANNASLFWPWGTYLVDSSIANFHNIYHIGDGEILRDGMTWLVDLRDGQTNTIYVSAPIGSDSNDGLVQTTPVQTLQRAVDIWKQYAASTAGKWIISAAGGTYTEGCTLSSIRGSQTVTIRGASAGITIIDGTSASGRAVDVNDVSCDVEIENFTINNFGGSSVRAIKNSSIIVTDVSIEGAGAGSNCIRVQNQSTARVGGNVTLRSDGRCVWCLENSTALVGVSGSDEIFFRSVAGDVGVGIEIQDSSVVSAGANGTIVIDFLGMKTAIEAHDNASLILGSVTCTQSSGSIFLNAYYNVTISNAGGSSARSISGGTHYVYLQNVTDVLTQQVGNTNNTPLQYWVPDNNPSGQNPNTSFQLVVSYDEVGGLQFLGPATGIIPYLNFNKNFEMEYDYGGPRIYFSVDGQNASARKLSLSNNTFRPQQDDELKCGSDSWRWSAVYALDYFNVSKLGERENYTILSANEKNAADDIFDDIKRFTHVSGDGRFNVGVQESDIIQAFIDNGLVIADYAFFNQTNVVEQNFPSPERMVVDPLTGVVTSESPASNTTLPASTNYSIEWNQLILFLLARTQ